MSGGAVLAAVGIIVAAVIGVLVALAVWAKQWMDGWR
jgi:hypothetical protein